MLRPDRYQAVAQLLPLPAAGYYGHRKNYSDFALVTDPSCQRCSAWGDVLGEDLEALEAAYHRADNAIQQIVDLLAA